VLRLDDLPEAPIRLLGATGSRRIDALVHDLVESSARSRATSCSPRTMGEAMLELRSFLFARVYEQGPAGAPETERARHGRAHALRALLHGIRRGGPCRRGARDGRRRRDRWHDRSLRRGGATRELYEPKAWSVL